MLKSWIADPDREFLCIAHRGESFVAPENTLAAFQLAIDARLPMIELDVQLSSDYRVMVFHDTSLQRTSNGQGRLRSKPAAHLKALDAGSWKSKEYAGEQIPFLEEVLELCTGKIALNIELKASISDKRQDLLVREVLEVLRKQGFKGDILFSSFSYYTVQALAEAQEDYPVGLLYVKPYLRHIQDLIGLINRYKASLFHCHFEEFQPEWADQLKLHGIPSLVYTVNDLVQAQTLKELGVNGIFSDVADELKSKIAL